MGDTIAKALFKRRLLEYIHNYRKWAQGRSPTYAEMGRHFGLDPATIKGYYINELIRSGWLKYTPRVARSLVPVYPVDVLYPLPETDEAEA